MANHEEQTSQSLDVAVLNTQLTLLLDLDNLQLSPDEELQVAEMLKGHAETIEEEAHFKIAQITKAQNRRKMLESPTTIKNHDVRNTLITTFVGTAFAAAVLYATPAEHFPEDAQPYIRGYQDCVKDTPNCATKLKDFTLSFF